MLSCRCVGKERSACAGGAGGCRRCPVGTLPRLLARTV